MSLPSDYLAEEAERKLAYLKDIIDTKRDLSPTPEDFNEHIRNSIEGGIVLAYSLGLYSVSVEGVFETDPECSREATDLVDLVEPQTRTIDGTSLLNFKPNLRIEQAAVALKGQLSAAGLIGVTVDFDIDVAPAHHNAFTLMIASQVEASVETNLAQHARQS